MSAPNGAAHLGRDPNHAVPTALLVGNPRLDSRTLAVAGRSVGLIRSGLADFGVRTGEPDLIDLADLLPVLSTHLVDGTDHSGQIAQAQSRIRIPGLLIVASPTFNGSYTGLLKLFIDLLPRQGLAGTVALPLMTAAWSRHRFVADIHLRALLVELGATVPVTGLTVIESEFSRLEQIVGNWSCTGLSVLAAVLNRPNRGHGTLVSALVPESGRDRGPFAYPIAKDGLS
jgi:FMN reductase